MKRAFGLDPITPLEDALDPKHLALLVYDLQVGTAGRVPGGEALIAKARDVLGAARSAGVRVFFCRHLTLPREVAGAAQLRGMMTLQRVTDLEAVKPNFLRGSPGFRIVPELEPLPTEAVFDKLTRSASNGSLLDFAWRDAGGQGLRRRRGGVRARHQTDRAARRGPRLLPGRGRRRLLLAKPRRPRGEPEGGAALGGRDGPRCVRPVMKPAHSGARLDRCV